MGVLDGFDLERLVRQDGPSRPDGRVMHPSPQGERAYWAKRTRWAFIHRGHQARRTSSSPRAETSPTSFAGPRLRGGEGRFEGFWRTKGQHGHQNG